jgi:hypothetical protein
MPFQAGTEQSLKVAWHHLKLLNSRTPIISIRSTCGKNVSDYRCILSPNASQFFYFKVTLKASGQ